MSTTGSGLALQAEQAVVDVGSLAVEPQRAEVSKPVVVADAETPAAETSVSTASAAAGLGRLDDSNVPADMTLLALARLFFGFGLRAFGGPVAQIAMLKEKLVDQDRWISPLRFNRALATYQALPGPEATEMCCYFGMVCKGRPGAVVAGLAFLLPGFVLMLTAAVLYKAFGADSVLFAGAFSALQPAVNAMVFRAVHKIGRHAVADASTGGVSRELAACAVIATLETVLGVNFFLTLLHTGLLYGFFWQSGRSRAASLVFAGVPLLIFMAFAAAYGSMDALLPLGVGIGGAGNNAATNFGVGLLGGLLTFGGAYTAIPLIRYETVLVGGWLSQQAFLDAIALGSVLPSPLVIFTTFVGYVSNGFTGALLMTLGMFLPAFGFTLIGHAFFERIVEAKGVVAHVLDGISAGVVGLIAVTAVQMLRTSIVRPQDSLIFLCSLAALHKSTWKHTPVAVVLVAAVVGHVLYDGPGGGSVGGSGSGSNSTTPAH